VRLVLALATTRPVLPVMSAGKSGASLWCERDWGLSCVKAEATWTRSSETLARGMKWLAGYLLTTIMTPSPPTLSGHI